jgi:gliding motility-associated-like protein
MRWALTQHSIFLIPALSCCSFFAKAQVIVSDSLALVALYNSTNGNNWTRKNNWLTGPVRTWYGITVVGNRVTQINMNPSSPPFSGNNLVGLIPTQIGNLSALTSLDLAYNKINGSLPSQLGSLPNLTFINIRNNQLSGNIPTSLGDLSNLTVLLLGNNQLSGTIPKELGNLAKLTQIDFTYNLLSGFIPPQLGDLSNLTQLLLQNNQLSGTIPPELGSLSKLITLSLSENQLSGSIPALLGNLGNLNELNLTLNQLSGNIPPQLGNLANLQLLRLNNNQLSGAVPKELGNLSKLQRLLLNNNQLSGAIPPELAGINTLTELRLNENSIVDLPTFSSATLTTLVVHNNNLTFEDLEPNMGIRTFIYSPQKIIPGAEVRNLMVGNLFTKGFSIGGSANVYQWQKNSAPVPGAVTHTITIGSVNFADAGTYELFITSPLVTGLTLQTEPTVLTVVDFKIDGQRQLEGSNINFGIVEVGDQRIKELEIINSGSVPFIVSTIIVTGDFSLAEPPPTEISANSNLTIPVSFSPTTIGSRTGTMTVIDGNITPFYSVNLTGEGDPELEVFNVVTTHSNNKHDFLKIRNIHAYPQNRVSIFDRWGNQVFVREGYDNNLKKFTGTSDNGVELPEGTYYYVIDIKIIKPLTGFLFLRRN